MTGHEVIFTRAGQVEVLPLSVQPPCPGEILVETIYSGVSAGTERAHLDARPNTYTHGDRFPFRPGYSSVGRVAQIGSGVTLFKPGQIVATTTSHRSHATIQVANRLGVLPAKFDDAAIGDGSIAPPSLVWPLSDHLTTLQLEASSTVTWSRVGLAGVRRARVEIGETVLVLGLGPIGLISVQFARLAGAVRVEGVDQVPFRCQVARETGADATYSSVEEAHAARDGRGDPDVVIEVTGNPAAVALAFSLCAPGGRVVLLSSSRGLSNNVNFYTDVHRKGIHIIGAHELTRPPE
jgi:2-desacetyl-2-hydroxyethyl bacteriochlorophyllide A dehydrogenase